MENIGILKIISAVLILAITVLASLYPFKKRQETKEAQQFPIGESLASGVFLGAGLLHMLPHSGHHFQEMDIHFPVPFLLAGIIFLALLWFEHLGRELYEKQGENSAAFAILAVIMLSIHSLLAGAALGLSGNFLIIVGILVAILSHKWAESFALAVHINRSTLSLKTCGVLFFLFAIMAPIGIILGDSLTGQVNPLLKSVMMSLASGTFLYLGTLHGLSRAVMVEKCCNLKLFSFVLIGFALMSIVAIWT